MDKLHIRLKSLRVNQGMTQEELADHCGIKKASVSAWENDKAQPKIEHLDTLKNLYGLTVDEILYGYESTLPKPSLCATVPFINWLILTNGESLNLNTIGTEQDEIPVSMPHSSETFATDVAGHSMTSDGVRSYPEGRTIICDPSLKDSAKSGQRVIAKIISSGIFTFKELVEEDGRRWLRSLNTHQQYQPITEPFTVEAVVIGSHIPE